MKAAQVLGVLVLLAASANALTFQVEPQSEETLYVELAVGQTFEMQFEVIRGGLLDIQLRVYSPKNRVIMEKMAYFSRREDEQPTDEGRVKFVASFTGTYRISFDNSISRWTAKVVTMDVLQGTGAQKSDDDIAKLEHLGPVVDSVIKISDDLEALERLQKQMRAREHQWHAATERTDSRLRWLTIVESLVLLGLAALQLRYIQTWFTDADKRGRV